MSMSRTGIRNIGPRLMTLLATCALSACVATSSGQLLQQYVPKNRAMYPLGELYLSNTQLRFTALEGEMSLKYAGVLPESAGEDMAGALVYRVKNAAGFFKRNAGKNAYCSEQPLWVAVYSRTGAPAWSNEVWVGLLTMEDWSTFRQGTDHACAGGNYVRTTS